MSKTADEVIEALLQTCPCDACGRYRRSFARRAAEWAVKLEESFKSAQRSRR